MSNKKKAPPKKEASGVNAIIIISLVLAVVMITVGAFSVIKMVNPDFFDGITSIFEKPVQSAYKETDEVTNYVKFSVKGHGDFVVELYPDIAPITVANFQMLVHDQFYDNLTFHRIADLTGKGGYIIQGGDPKGNGTGGSTTIKGEFSANGVPNNLSHTRGVISMARRGDSYDSGSCQFFICVGDVTVLDGQYATFGRVVEGMDVVDSINGVPLNGTTPAEKVVIESARFAKAK